MCIFTICKDRWGIALGYNNTKSVIWSRDHPKYEWLRKYEEYIMNNNEFMIGEQYDNYCVDCDCITCQKYKGKYTDDSEMFICMICGCENYKVE